MGCPEFVFTFWGFFLIKSIHLEPTNNDNKKIGHSWFNPVNAPAFYENKTSPPGGIGNTFTFRRKVFCRENRLSTEI